MLKQMLEQKLKVAIGEAKQANEDSNVGYEAGAANAAGQYEGWVEALEWMLSALDRTFTPADIELVQIKYVEPLGGEGRSYFNGPMMRWEAVAELVHEAELTAAGHERWLGSIIAISR